MSISTLSEKYVVDTHALIWYAEGNPRLGQQAKQVLEHAESSLILPLIVLAESAWIIDSLTREGLSIPELHDRLIVSTGLYLQDLGHTVSILTRDEEIIKAGALSVIW